MDLLELNGYQLRGLARNNLILGKNGCGKSRLLEFTEQALRDRDNIGALRYLSPERGGVLIYEAGIDQELTNNPNWLYNSRRQNQTHNFRQQSAAQFRRLELLILRDIEQNPASRQNPKITFESTIARINTLLDRVSITRNEASFAIIDRASSQPVQPGEISSGESELISLGIECLVFERECKKRKLNIILIDEPDVHLHPDLQARFAKFIENLTFPEQTHILIATHSTALLAAVSGDDQTRLAFMRSGETDITFSPLTETYKKVLPVFGAHPLSNVFNQAPVLLLEGEDDERVWQQAVRSARGRIKI
jgi:predicted ATPase